MIPFNIPYYSGKEKKSISNVMDTKILTGDFDLMGKCEQLLKEKYKFPTVHLTNSCTTALEIAALLVNIEPGDEVILPSYTYVSTANSFALRGAKLVFVDSKSDHPNMDEALIADLITMKTKAIVLVHYAGVACDMDKVLELARKNNIYVIEDAAQCIDSFYKKKPLGSIGDIACFSFHETKNIHCGEGGCLVVNNPALFERADQIKHKGTNRSAFIRNEVKKYEWVDLGFSATPSAISVAFLYPQLLDIDKVQEKRKKNWNRYLENFSNSGLNDKMQLSIVPSFASKNGHIFYVVCKSENERNALIEHLKKNSIQAVFHYQSLHNSPYYRDKHDGRNLPHADRYSKCLVRLPLFFDLTLKEIDFISEKVIEFYK